MPLKVLTVDDSKTIRMIVKKAFRPYDCELSEAENGVEGLAAAAKIIPGLIVLDITMPVMNGIEMLGKLKAEPSLKDIPVVMLTAESGKDNVMQIVKMGVKEYIVKPFKGEQLIERVENIVKLDLKKEDTAADDGSKKYFSIDGDYVFLKLPETINRPVTVAVETHLSPKVKEMVDAGMAKMIVDISKAKEVNMALIKMIILTLQTCQKSNVAARVVGTASLSEELKGFQETSSIEVQQSVAEAKAAF